MMTFEKWLFDLIRGSFSTLSANKKADGISLRLTDRGSISKYQILETYELVIEKSAKITASNLAAKAGQAIEALPEHNYVHASSIDATVAQRQGEPTRWVYSVVFTVTRRRDVTDWEGVE